MSTPDNISKKKAGSIERELKMLATGAAAMFVTLSAALVVVMGSLGEQISVFDEEIVPTERAVGEMLESIGAVSDREAAVLSAADAQGVDAVGDDTLARETAEGALQDLRTTLEGETVQTLGGDFDLFIESARDVTNSVRTSHETDAALAAALESSQDEVAASLALIDELEGQIQLRYVLLLRALAKDPNPETVAELVVGHVRDQGERVSQARTQIEVMGRRIEQVALTRNRDELNSLSSNGLAQAFASARSSVEQLHSALIDAGDTKLAAKASSLTEQIHTTVALVTGEDSGASSNGGLVPLRHSYFDALAQARTAQVDGRQRSTNARKSLHEAGDQARSLAAQTQQKARSVMESARLGVTLLVLIGLAACGYSARRVLTAMGALRQQNSDLANLRDELAEANEGLERRVAARTAELASREASTRLLLDSMGDALFEADASGRICGERSRATEEWFGEALKGDAPCVWEVLPGTDAQRASVEFGWDQLADGFLPFEVAADQIPSRFKDDQRSYDVEYRQADGGNVLVIVRDWTANEIAEEAEAKAREFQSLVGNLLEDREGFELIHDECERQMEELESSTEVNGALRLLHTLKGNTASFGFSAVANLAHALEDWIGEENTLPSSDQIHEIRAAWTESIGTLQCYLDSEESGSLKVQASELERLQRFLAEAHPHAEILRYIDSWQLTPARNHLLRLERQARRIAASLAKDVDVHINDNDIRIPEQLDPFWSALVHVIRNSVDHGIESPEERESKGKSARGHLQLCTRLSNQVLTVEVSDDGAGIDVDGLRERLSSLNSSISADSMSVLDLIAAEGLSSRDQVSDISGRGIGVSATVAAARDLGGEVEVKSTLGSGTLISFTFDLSPSGGLSLEAAA